MPKLDEAKERLGILKFWLGIFVTILVGLISWIFTHYKDYADKLEFYSVCMCSALLLILILLGNAKSKKILKEIKDKNGNFCICFYDSKCDFDRLFGSKFC